jgi:hypothetical protein
MSIRAIIVLALLALASPVFAQSLGVDIPNRHERLKGDAPPRTEVLSKLHEAFPEAQSWDPTIAALGNNVDGWAVKCFAADGDDLYIGGDFRAFDTVTADFLVHYNRTTKVWNALDQGPHNTVNALAIHNGKLYVGGNFATVGAARIAVNHIAMWDGTSWHALGTGTNDIVSSLAFLGDTLYAGGNFTSAGGSPAYYLARWNGSGWEEANGGTSYPVEGLYATSDSLFVAGHFNYVGSENKNTGLRARGIAMLRRGSWSSLGSGIYSYHVALFQGKVWASSDYYNNDGNLVYELAAWDGTNWTAFGSDTLVGTAGTGDVYGLFPIGDSLIVLGNFSQMAGVTTKGAAVYHNGTWSELSGGLFGYGYTAIAFDGKLYVGGRFSEVGGITTEAIAALQNGTWSIVAHSVAAYIGWQSDDVQAIATNDRYVFIGGRFTMVAGKVCNHIAAWDKQLKQWSTLGKGVDGDVWSIVVQGNTLVAGGSFNHAGGVTARHIAMCNLTTKLWTPMGAGATRNISAIATDANGVYASVYFQVIDNIGYDFVAKWDGNEWRPIANGLRNGYIQALAWQGPTLYATGSFLQTDDGTTVNRIAQLQAGMWGALNAGLDDEGYALAVSGNTLFVGGYFGSADGLASPALAAWDGTNWIPIGNGFDNGVLALASDGAGGVYAGGRFTTVAGATRDHLIHWDGTKYSTVFGGVSNDVEAMATDADALYVGGWLEIAGASNVRSLHFAALHGAGVSGVGSNKRVDPALSIFPNPISNSSTISISLDESTYLRLELFNALGERVARIAERRVGQGNSDFTLDARPLPNGLYFLRLTADGMVTTHTVQIEH